MEELKVSSSAYFVTLTYDDDHAEIDDNGMMTLKKTDLQAFFKTLRKRNREKLRYYACGEYGTKSWRPHYHIILFNASLETLVGQSDAWDMKSRRLPMDGTFRSSCQSWDKGAVTVGQVTEASATYVAGYIMKQDRLKPDGIYECREKEFSLMSKGIGKSYITPAVRQYHRQPGKVIERANNTRKGGDKIALSRYYRERLLTTNQRRRLGVEARRQNEKDFKAKTVENLKQEERIKIEKFAKYERNKGRSEKEL